MESWWVCDVCRSLNRAASSKCYSCRTPVGQTAPKTADGKIDYNVAKTGVDLREFVDQKLFPYFPNTIEYKIGQICGEIRMGIAVGCVTSAVRSLTLSGACSAVAARSCRRRMRTDPTPGRPAL